jgi:hypothetical protein
MTKTDFLISSKNSLKTLVITLACLAAGPATASQGTSAGHRDTDRADSVVDRQPASAVIKGALICEMAPVNDGRPCSLKLKEAETGKIYELTPSTAARRLYLDGTRNVAIQGVITEGDSIQVTSAEALR